MQQKVQTLAIPQIHKYILRIDKVGYPGLICFIEKRKSVKHIPKNLITTNISIYKKYQIKIFFMTIII